MSNASGTPSRILLVGEPLPVEGNAGGPITPGDLVVQAADGDLEVHGTALGATPPIFAREADLEGKGITDAYAAGDRVYAHGCRRNDVVQARVGTGVDLNIGSLLESAGDGTLRLITTGTAIAVSMVDKTTSGTEHAKVRVL